MSPSMRIYNKPDGDDTGWCVTDCQMILAYIYLHLYICISTSNKAIYLDSTEGMYIPILSVKLNSKRVEELSL